MEQPLPLGRQAGAQTPAVQAPEQQSLKAMQGPPLGVHVMPELDVEVLTLDVPKHPDETQGDNNRLLAPIAIREEKLRVLVVESLPRWEYRYLRNALSRDPGVDVRCLLFHPGLSKVGGGNKDYIKQFPAGLDELSKFDVVFLGDIGVEGGSLAKMPGLIREARDMQGIRKDSSAPKKEPDRAPPPSGGSSPRRRS